MMGQRKPEWVFQAWLSRFLDHVVLPPCEIRGFDVASAAMASPATRFAQAGRGIKAGSPDHEVVQGNPTIIVKLELKAGHGTSTDAQISTADSYERCGVPVIRDCRTVRQALNGIRAAGVRLHGNADNIAVEYQARVDAGLAALQAGKGKPRKASKPRDRTPKSRIRRGAAIYARNLPGMGGG